MADLIRAPRGRRLLRVVGALAAPVLVLSGLALERDDSGQTRDQDAAIAPRAQPLSESPSRSAAPAAPTARAGVPRQVAIPRLGVRAAVAPITVVDGALTPPADPQRLGWWSDGARPGDAAGTTVITGHTVHTGGGALDDLEDLAPGDAVAVSNGRTPLVYDVTSVQILSSAAVARRHRQLFNQGGSPRLMLVTCEDWDGEAYLSSVIVVAEPREPR